MYIHFSIYIYMRVPGARGPGPRAGGRGPAADGRRPAGGGVRRCMYVYMFIYVQYTYMCM